MFRSMGVPGVDDDGWRHAARGWFMRAVDDRDVHVTVVEVDGRVVSVAQAIVEQRAPSPGTPSGRTALVSNVSTDPEHRGRGYGRLAFEEVMRWLREESDVQSASLHTTGMAAQMYEKAGFEVHSYPEMRLTLRR